MNLMSEIEKTQLLLTMTKCQATGKRTGHRWSTNADGHIVCSWCGFQGYDR